MEDWYGTAVVTPLRAVRCSVRSRVLFLAVLAAAMAVGVVWAGRGGLDGGTPFQLIDATLFGAALASVLPATRPDPAPSRSSLSIPP